MRSRPSPEGALSLPVCGLLGLLLTLQACAGADPEPWHSARLSAEFTTQRTDITSFEAYQALEDTLFAQLESQVYGEVGTGPEFSLVRYSAGSAADPLLRVPDWNLYALRSRSPGTVSRGACGGCREDWNEDGESVGLLGSGWCM